MPRSRHGFTLVEIAIVLVVIGLLVGGVLTGQSLIHSSQLQSVPRESAKYTSALGAFRDKYFALPGDMPNAVSFWGAAAGATTDGVDAACQALTTPSTDQTTCNGDGNGQIDNGGGGAFLTTGSPESLRAWQHLANAALVEGAYTGVQGSPIGIVPGENVPASKINLGGWSWESVGSSVGQADLFAGDYGQTLIFGAGDSDIGNAGHGDVLIPEDAANIDTKADDGFPNTGTIRTPNNTSFLNCLDVSGEGYDLARETVGCHLIFITGY